MNTIIRIEPVTPDTKDGVQAVLQASNLMALDTDNGELIALAASDPQAGIVGCAAVERYGNSGLLRSVAVHPDQRGRHLGQYLVAAAEAEAFDVGIEALYLLTETAETFFAKQGYEVVDRSVVPDTVRASDQFAAGCPSTAVAMYRDLTEID